MAINMPLRWSYGIFVFQWLQTCRSPPEDVMHYVSTSPSTINCQPFFLCQPSSRRRNILRLYFSISRPPSTVNNSSSVLPSPSIVNPSSSLNHPLSSLNLFSNNCQQLKIHPTIKGVRFYAPTWFFKNSTVNCPLSTNS